MNLNKVELKLATLETKHTLENLMSLYLHDLSAFADDLKISENGKFKYDGMELYFSKEDLKPFIICVNNEIAGFVLLNSGKYVPKDIDYNVNELFILKTFRKKGIAAAAIKKIFDMYKGTYIIGQLIRNDKAVNFWKGFYKKQGIEYAEEMILEDGVECLEQKFCV